MPRPPTPVREALSDCMAEYAAAIDDDRLEDWLALFTEDCDYRIITRENVEQGLSNVLMWCDNKNMLRDRVASYRHVNEYNLHWDRHVVGPLRYTAAASDRWSFEAAYSLFQTEREGASRLFSVGRYKIDARINQNGAPLLRTVIVIADTGLVPSLLATPI